MGCNCNNERKKDKDYVRKMAVKYSETFEVDVVLHVFSIRGVGKEIYDFTEDIESVGSNGFIELIKFRRNKSKNVLSGSVFVDGGTGTTKKSRSKPGKPIAKVVGSDEPVKKIKRK